MYIIIITESKHLDSKKLEILQAMSKAREDNCSLKVRYGKVLACGAGAAGKTNFFNLLMEENFQPLHISTALAKTQQVTIAMKARLSKTTDKKVTFSKMDIDSEIDQLLSYLPKKYTTPSPQIRDTPADEKRHVQINTKVESYTIAEEMMSSKLASNADVPTPHLEEVWDILTFMDTGGQPQFISMLPAVNTFAMITFIVHKITGGKSSLTEKVIVKHGNKSGNRSFEPHEHEYTYHELIKTLMSYASSVLLPDKTFLNKFKKIKSGGKEKDTNTSSISFIATHSSHVSENDIQEIDDELIEIVKHSSTGGIKAKLNTNYKCIVPLDNKTQGKNSVETCTNDKQYTNPSSIREYIHKYLIKQDVYSVPIKWLLLELEIRKVCINKNCSFITYNEVLKLSSNKNLGEENFIKNGLRFHHLFGVLLYFEEVEGMRELVITDHQWLFKRLTDIVLYSFEDHSDQYTDCVNCKEKGIFKETMLDELDINTDFEKSEINIKTINPKKSFLNLLQHLRIIAPLNEDPSQYFMPSLLKSCNLSNLQERFPGTSKFTTETNMIIDSEPLLLQFKSTDSTNSFPRGIFCFLVVQLIHCTKWELYGQAYDNLLCFIKKDTAHYIALIDRIFFLELQVTHESDQCVSVHAEIFDTVVRALLEIGSRLDIEIKLQYGFWCKKCIKPEETHISLFEREYMEYCYCREKKPTKLEMSHEIWLKSFKVRTHVHVLYIYIYIYMLLHI